jgi:phosphate transport system permease protein
VPAVKLKLRRAAREYIIRGFLLLCALSSLVFLAGIVFVLFSQGLRIFGFVRITDFLFGRNWYPTHEIPEFGILPMIYGSVVITFGALILAAPLGIASALFISEVAPSRLKEIIKPVVELLGGIPSVVYGLFGAMVVAPFVQRLFNLPTGLTALSAAIVLGIMILPTITSIVEDAFSAIPNEYREAALALGATKWETMTKIVLPAASSGITTGVILGMGRAIGETMAVLMVAGGSARIDFSLLKPVRAMTSTIAAEMAETVKGSDHFYSLFAIAVVLFIITFIFNLVAGRVTARFQRRFTGSK